MQLLRGFVASLVFVVSVLGLDFGNITQLQAINSSQDATVFALIYGAPLLQCSKAAAGPQGLLTSKGTDQFASPGRLSTPSLNVVVSPNVDAVYDFAIFDLATQDRVLNVPPMELDRFDLFSLYDP
jgi:hypothetical protein